MNLSINKGLLEPLFLPEGIKQICKDEEVKIRRLTFKVFKEMLLDVAKKNLSCFDAHARDFGCERQALAIYQLARNKEVQEELVNLNKINITENSLDQIEVSEEVGFLARCYLLKKFSTVKVNNNCEMTCIDYVKLNSEAQFELSNNKIKGGGILKRFIGPIQAKVSEISLKLLQIEVSKITSIPHEMLKTKFEKVEPKKGVNDEGPKYIASSYYSLKACLQRFQELEIPLLIKKKVSQNKETFCLLYSSLVKGFEFIENKESLNKEAPLIVIEGAVREDLGVEELKSVLNNKIKKIIKMIGALSERTFIEDDEVVKKRKKAFEKEWVTSSLLKENKESFEEAQKRIAEELQVGIPKKRIPFDLYHLYCSTVKEEENRGVKVYGK